MKKKNSAKRRLLSAAGMLAVSAAMLSSATFAWFTMNKEVSVTGLQTTARAEKGIVIAPYTYSEGTLTAPADSAFSDTAAAYNPISDKQLLPTFTVDTTKWYHAMSKQADNGQDYAAAAVEVTNDSSNDNYYYEMNKFQIKSYAESQPIYVESITVQSPRTAQNYDDALRVLVKTTDGVKIFSKDGSRTNTENLTGDASKGTITLTAANTENAKVINSATTTPTDVEIYLYFDGEDAACKSTNIVDFTAIKVDVKFATSAPFTPGA